MDQIDRYLETIYLQEELISLNEFDLKKIVSKVLPEKKIGDLIKKMKSASNDKKPVESLKKIRSLVKTLPLVNEKKFDSYLVSKVDNYKMLKKKAQTIVENSLPNISKSAIEYSSMFLAISTLFVPKKQKNITPDKLLKSNIKTFVMKVRKFTSDYEEDDETESKFKKEDIPDLAVAWTIITMSIVVGWAAYSGLSFVMSALASALPIVIIVIVGAWILGTGRFGK